MGILALDIDGTLTGDDHALSLVRRNELEWLHAKGWNIIFITGRPFSWAARTLSVLPFPYGFAVQNGALLLQMPERKVLYKRYLDHKALKRALAIRRDCAVYGGYEEGETCYYCPADWTSFQRDYAECRAHLLREEWRPLRTWEELPLIQFPSLKYFAIQEESDRLAALLEREGFHAPPIRDPFETSRRVLQVTDPCVTKGQALHDYKHILGEQLTVAAGDDWNDLSMLEACDHPFVVDTAPDNLKKLFTVVLPQKALLKTIGKTIIL